MDIFLFMCYNQLSLLLELRMITGIAHAAINTKDMEKSLDFYIRVLGFSKAFSIEHPETKAPWIEYLQSGSQFIELFYNGTEDNP